MKNRIFYKVLRIAQNKFIPIFIKNNFFVKNWKNLKAIAFEILHFRKKKLILAENCFKYH